MQMSTQAHVGVGAPAMQDLIQSGILKQFSRQVPERWPAGRALLFIAAASVILWAAIAVAAWSFIA